MKKSLLLLGAALLAVTAQAEVATQLYAIGGPFGGWATDKGEAMTQTSEGVFTIEKTFYQQEWFGFVNQLCETSGDWDTFNAHRYGAKEDGTIPELGTPTAIFYPGSAAFTLEAGFYNIEVDTKNMLITVTEAGALTVYDGDLYFRGMLNDWGTGDDYLMTKQNKGVYTYTIPSLAAGSEFKFADEPWGYVITSGNAAMKVGETYPIVNGDNMAFAEDVQNVVCTVDLNENTINFTQDNTNLVNELAVDADAEYFNLQGVRVANPDKGLYIVRKAGKVYKSAIR